jgi:ribonuclease HI
MFGNDFEMEPIIDERHWRRANGDNVTVHEGTIRDDEQLTAFLEDNNIETVYSGDGSCDDNRLFYLKGIAAGAAYVKISRKGGEVESKKLRCPIHSQAYDAEGLAYDAILNDLIETHGNGAQGRVNVAVTPDCLSLINVIEKSKVNCELHVRREAKLKFLEEKTEVVQHIKHVKAHVGNVLNEAVDQHAKDACRLGNVGGRVTLGVVKAAIAAEIKRDLVRRVLTSEKSDVREYLRVKKGVKKNTFYSDHKKREWRAVIAMQCGRYQPKDLAIPAGSNRCICRHCYEIHGKRVPFNAIHFIKGCKKFKAVRDRHEYIKGNTAAVVMREYEMELLGYVGDCYDEMNLGEEHECDNAEGSDDDDEMIEMECDE